LQRSWAVRHHERMNPYSEDLRKKIVEAVQRGMPKIEAARTFGVGISSVKRYVAAAREGRSLTPKKRPGSEPKLDESARRLLEADLQGRPCHRGVSSCGGCAGWRSVTLRFPGSSSAWDGLEKKIGGCERERRVSEGCLASDGRQGDPRRAAGVCGRVLHQHLALAPVRLVSTRRASALFGATLASLGSERHCAGEHERGRDGRVPGG
jgi:transposase